MGTTVLIQDGSIRGKGAFRNFNATIHELGVDELWYAYKNQAL